MTLPADLRARFGVPADLAYLDCAYLSPLLDTVRAAGHRGVDRKAAPWAIRREHFFDEVEAVRARFAALVGGDADGVAILPSTSYGTAVGVACRAVGAARAVDNTQGGGALRVSPHLWCTEADIDRVLAAPDHLTRSRS